ncbi:MAG: RsmE family RNA methyltransferase [Rickettsiaceae bacterium]|nr:RsmE family RNA methyltransferase [Rickettsiaceae bacterium]
MKYSKLPRVYIKEEINTNSLIEIQSELYDYIINVLRAKKNFQLRVFNEKNGEFFAEVKIEGKNCRLLIKEKFEKPPILGRKITLISSLIRPEKFELICDMATQMGIYRIIPLITERVQQFRAPNYTRLKKIIEESVRQSERLDFPILEEAKTFEQIDLAGYTQILFANENEKNTEHKIGNLGENIAIIVGPEGGFTEIEVKKILLLDNVASLSLGSYVLRSETAAIALLARLMLL